MAFRWQADDCLILNAAWVALGFPGAGKGRGGVGVGVVIPDCSNAQADFFLDGRTCQLIPFAGHRLNSTHSLINRNKSRLIFSSAEMFKKLL